MSASVQDEKSGFSVLSAEQNWRAMVESSFPVYPFSRKRPVTRFVKRTQADASRGGASGFFARILRAFLATAGASERAGADFAERAERRARTSAFRESTSARVASRAERMVATEEDILRAD
jgi:hypothetical protein